MANTRRQRRVAETLQKELGSLLQHSVADPHLVFVSVTWVDVSPDLKNARVYVSHLGDTPDDDAEVVQALERASGFLRRELAGRLQLRVVPHLAFKIDAVLERARHIDALLDQIPPAQTEHDGKAQ